MPQRGCRMRLNKYLAQCGVCSRRDADKLIEQGKVLVNGQVAGMGQQVLETDTVQVGKKILQGKQTCKVLAFYKPVGVVCTERDPHAEKKIMDMFDKGVTVLFVSHSLEQVQRICDRAIILDGGHLVAKGPVDKVARIYKNMTE